MKLYKAFISRLKVKELIGSVDGGMIVTVLIPAPIDGVPATPVLFTDEIPDPKAATSPGAIP